MADKEEITAWVHFLAQIEEVRIALGGDQETEIFYRGHSKAQYKLSPGLLRFSTETKSISKKVWEAEKDMFYEFQSRARELHTRSLSDWDILFYMQHHKMRTRLLDWTEIFGVALFFALDPYNKEKLKSDYSPCIYMMNPYMLNESFGHTDDLWSPENLEYYGTTESVSYSDILMYKSGKGAFGWDEPIALYPQRRGDRINNQGGYFTIHGNDIRPLERIASENLIKKIIIPSTTFSMARKFLEQAGINHYTLFPDLDGLATYLTQKYYP